MNRFNAALLAYCLMGVRDAERAAHEARSSRGNDAGASPQSSATTTLGEARVADRAALARGPLLGCVQHSQHLDDVAQNPGRRGRKTGSGLAFCLHPRSLPSCPVHCESNSPVRCTTLLREATGTNRSLLTTQIDTHFWLCLPRQWTASTPRCWLTADRHLPACRRTGVEPCAGAVSVSLRPSPVETATDVTAAARGNVSHPMVVDKSPHFDRRNAHGIRMRRVDQHVVLLDDHD